MACVSWDTDVSHDCFPAQAVPTCAICWHESGQLAAACLLPCPSLLLHSRLRPTGSLELLLSNCHWPAVLLWAKSVRVPKPKAVRRAKRHSHSTRTLGSSRLHYVSLAAWACGGVEWGLPHSLVLPSENNTMAQAAGSCAFCVPTSLFHSLCDLQHPVKAGVCLGTKRRREITSLPCQSPPSQRGSSYQSPWVRG